MNRKRGDDATQIGPDTVLVWSAAGAPALGRVGEREVGTMAITVKDEITKDVLISVAIKAFPYSEQMQNFDTQSEPDAIRFDWRGTRFRVSTSFFCEEAKNGMLHGSDLALLAEHLMKRAWVQMMVKP